MHDKQGERHVQWVPPGLAGGRLMKAKQHMQIIMSVHAPHSWHRPAASASCLELPFTLAVRVSGRDTHCLCTMSSYEYHTPMQSAALLSVAAEA